MASNPSGGPLGLRLVPPHERFRHAEAHLSGGRAAVFNSVLVLRDAKYLLLESQQTDGTWAGTRMWFAVVNDTIFLRTKAGSPEVRRMSRRPIVKLTPCATRGKPVDIECMARIMPPEREAQAEAAIRRGYGLLRQAFNRFARNDHVYLELTPIDLKGRSLREDEALSSDAEGSRGFSCRERMTQPAVTAAQSAEPTIGPPARDAPRAVALQAWREIRSELRELYEADEHHRVMASKLGLTRTQLQAQLRRLFKEGMPRR